MSKYKAKTMCFGIMTSFQYLKRTAARTSSLILKGEVWRNFWLLIETSAQWKLKHWSPQGNYCQNHKNWTFCWIQPIESNHSEFRMQQIVSAELKFGVIHVVPFYLLEKGRSKWQKAWRPLCDLHVIGNSFPLVTNKQ